MSEYKVILVGNSATGKTTMSNVLAGGDPRQFSPSTIGAEYRKYTPVKWYGSRKTIGIWDTAGQPRYTSIVQMYFRNCSCILYCIPADATLGEYQEEMDRTMRTIQDSSRPDTIVYVVVTKCDLMQLPWQLEWVEKWSWTWTNLVKNVFYTSSYESPDGVVRVFDTVADSIDQVESKKPQPKQRDINTILYSDGDSDHGGTINDGKWKDGGKRCSGGCTIF